MNGAVVEPLCRTFWQTDVALHFHLDFFVLYRRLILLLDIFLLRGFLERSWLFVRRGIIADESDLLDESISGFALCGFGRRLGFLGLGLLGLLFFQRVEGEASGCFGEVNDKWRVLLRIHFKLL